MILNLAVVVASQMMLWYDDVMWCERRESSTLVLFNISACSTVVISTVVIGICSHLIMDWEKIMTVYGAILVASGFILGVLLLPYALDVVEADRTYPMACEFILVVIILGQLFSICVTSCSPHSDDWIICNLFVYYPILWFCCGAGQLIIVVLMIINAIENSDAGVKGYGGVIISGTILYMCASFVYYSIIIFTMNDEYHNRI